MIIASKAGGDLIRIMEVGRCGNIMDRRDGYMIEVTAITSLR